MRGVPILVMALAMTASVSTRAETGPDQPIPAQARVVVDRLRADPALEAVAAHLTEDLLVHIAETTDIKAISRAELQLLAQHVSEGEALSPEHQGQWDAILAEVTAAGEAEYILSGHIGMLGDSYIGTVSRLEVASSQVGKSQACTADDEQGLATCLKARISTLLGQAPRSTAGFTWHKDQRRIAVWPLETYAARPGLSKNLTELVAIELKKAARHLSVASTHDVMTMLQYSVDRAKVTGAELDEVMALGAALGADYLVTGGVGRLDQTFVVVLKLIDFQQARVVHRVAESYRGPEAYLGQAVRFAVAQLLDQPRSGAGDLTIAVEPDPEPQPEEGPVQLFLNGGPAMTWPVPTAFRKLTVGKHTVRIEAPGFEVFDEEAYVEPGMNRFRAELQPLPPPLYKRWWFWTTIGVVVAAGTAGAVVALRPEGSHGTNNEAVDRDAK